jgi:hypothetical protein
MAVITTNPGESIRLYASLLPSEQLRHLAAACASLWALRLHPGEIHEHYAAALGLLGDDDREAVADAFCCEPDELWDAYVRCADAERRRMMMVMAAAFAADTVVAQTDDVEPLLDTLLGWFDESDLRILENNARTLYLTAHSN